jgi:hypothetical protein
MAKHGVAERALLGALLTARAPASGAVLPPPTPAPAEDVCATWMLYALRPIRLIVQQRADAVSTLTDISEVAFILTAAMGQQFVLGINPPLVEWGLPGVCRGAHARRAGGRAGRADRCRPAHGTNFSRVGAGGTRCAKCVGAQCHVIDGLRPTDTVSAAYGLSMGMWTIQIASGQRRFTFVTIGSVHFAGSNQPVWEPFAGSSTNGVRRLDRVVGARSSGVSIMAEPCLVRQHLRAIRVGHAQCIG